MGGNFWPKPNILIMVNFRKYKFSDFVHINPLVKLKANDFGIEAGVGFNFYMRFFILSPEIKISNGISNVHSRDASLKFSNVIDKIQSRQIVFSLIFEG